MNKKGQIITVDFVFSLILLMLALGCVFRIAEANQYKMKEDELFMDLQRIGTASAELLVSSPDFVCEVTMGGQPQYLNNCINELNLNTADKAKLGIPAQYKFQILLNGVHRAGDSAPNPVNPNSPNVYSEERSIVSMPGNPTIDQIKSCMTGGACPLTEKKVMLKVWKE